MHSKETKIRSLMTRDTYHEKCFIKMLSLEVFSGGIFFLLVVLTLIMLFQALKGKCRRVNWLIKLLNQPLTEKKKKKKLRQG